MSPGRGSRRIAGGGEAAGCAEQPFDRGHRPDQAFAVAVRQRGEHGGDLVVRTAIELREGLTSLGGQAELVLPPVRGQRLAGDQPAVVEILDDPAEIAGIETELDPDLLRRQVFAGGELVQHPRLAQRERAFQQVLVEHAELAGVEAVEGAYRRDLAVGIRLGHGAPRYLPLSNNYLTLASIWCAPHATMIRLRNSVRDERPSCRSSLASERRASGA